MASQGLSELIESIKTDFALASSNQLTDVHRHMILNAISKRRSVLNRMSESDYIDYYFKNKKAESDCFLSLLTIHHTFFFREYIHFQYIEKNLKSIVDRARKQGRKKIKVWSAACSKGHEVYSLAMFLDEHLKIIAPDFDYEVHGTDIDEESVGFAKNAVYKNIEIEKSPIKYLQGRRLLGSGDISDYSKVHQDIRKKCSFSTLNLVNDSYHEKYDIIFCRNVLIYFNKEDVHKTIEKLSPCLYEGGYLITGVSESIVGQDLPVVHLGPSVYKLESHLEADETSSNTDNVTEEVKKRAIRIVCVDDSPVILKILKRTFARDDEIEIVGTAEDGEEAKKVVDELKPDAVTLDLHMPGVDGLAYMEQNFKSGHPPVIVVSGINRNETGLLDKMLKLGVSDYIQKPDSTNYKEIGDELKAKIKIALGPSGVLMKREAS